MTSFGIGLLGVLTGISIGRHEIDDTVTAKVVNVVDDEGNSKIRLDANGISLKGEASGDSTLLRAGGLPQLEFTHGGYNTLVLGSMDSDSDGLMCYYHGARRFVMIGDKDSSRAVVGVEPEASSVEDLLSFERKKINAAGMVASANQSLIFSRDKDGKEKSINPDSP